MQRSDRTYFQSRGPVRFTAILPYVFAIGISTLALLIAVLLQALIAPTMFPLFFAAVALSAWYGGLGAGLLSTVLSSLLINYILNASNESFNLAFNDLLRLGVFVLVSLLISSLNESRNRAETAVRDQRNWFQITLASIGDAVIVTDTQQIVTFINPVAATLTGWSPAEAIGKELSQIFPIINETSRAPAENPVARVLKEGIIVGLANHTLLITREGLEIPIDDSAAPIRNDKGQIIGTVLVFRDISARRQTENALRQSEARFRLLAENARDMIYRYQIKPNMRCEYVSPAVQTILGYTPSDYYANPDLPRQIVHPNDYQLFDSVAQNPAHYTAPLVMRWIRKDGAVIWTEQRNVPIYDSDGQVVAIEGIARDITEHKWVEEALRESEARFRTMADTAPVLIWMADTTLEFIFFNRSWERFTGRAIEEELGNAWLDGIHPDDLAAYRDTYTAAFHAQREFNIEHRLRRSDGEYRWVLNSGVPRFTPDGSFSGYIGSCIDITERKQAEERLRFLAEAGNVLSSSLDYEATLSNVARLVVPDTADWCAIDMVNAAGDIELLALAHIDPEKVQWGHELRRRYPVDLNAPRGTPNVIRTGQSEIYPDIPEELLLAAAKNDEELSILRAVGYRSVMIVPMCTQERVIGAISFVATESGRRFGPADLTLAEELARRAAIAIDNARLYREAQHALQARNQFLSIAAHELKTPLTTLLGYAQLLKRRVERENSLHERNRQIIHILSEQAVRLDRLISSLLDLSRIEMGQFAIEHKPVDIVGLTQRVVGEIWLSLDKHELTLHSSDAAIFINGDELRLEQVLNNLILNAVKYSPNGGKISVNIQRKADTVQLMVSDQGIGIPAEAIPHLFQRFFRAANVSTRHLSGLGIGLYVVREIIALHEGTIEVESIENEGSTFTMTLPCANTLP